MNVSHVVSFAIGAACVGSITLLAGVPAKKPAPAPAEPAPQPVTFSYKPLDPAGELIEPIPDDVEELFEDYLEVDYHPARIELGKRLFHDTRLSADNTLSCASCHDLRYAGIDRSVTATGVRGQVGPINTPSVFNSVFNVRQFWDGRAADLEAQADGPPNTPGEMDSNWDEISSKLSADGSLVALLHEAYPNEDFSGEVDSRFWLAAIADYERTLVTPNAPFDRYLMGDAEAIDREAKEGYQIFKDIGCIECHNGIAIGGKSFQRLGRMRPYFDEHTAAVNLGRFNVTGADDDRNVFKVSNLRNVALTAPYFHDGSQETLADAIRCMATHQLDLTLSDAQTERIEAFLHTLTGEWDGIPLNEIQNTIGIRN